MRGAHARKGFAMDKGLGMSSHAPVFGLRLGQALSGLNGFAARSIKRRLILVLGLVLVLQALVGASQLAGMLVSRSARSEERRVGKECVSTGRSRWSPSHSKKNINITKYRE